MKKIFISLFIFLSFALPILVKAQEQESQRKKFGSSCVQNLDCKSGFCDKGTDGKSYCSCSVGIVGALSCKLEFGEQSGEEWSCSEGGDQNLQLGFCKSNIAGRTTYPVGGASNLDILFNSSIAQDEVKKLTSKPTLKINIPGLKFSDPQITTESGNTYLSFPLLGEYIKAIYRVGIAIAGIVSVIMIIVAGFLWAASGGNTEVITQQKQRIEKAVIGLIIAVGSYTILFSINPRLTEFGSLKVEYINTLNLDKSIGNEDVMRDTDLPTRAANATPVKVEPGAMSYGFNNVPYFAQGVGEWANLPYGGPSCSTYRGAGCGPSSIAMVLRFYGKDVDPRHVGAFAVDTGARSCHGGTSTTKRFLEALETKYDVKIEVVTNKQQALTLLRSGKPLVQGGEHIGFTNKNIAKYYDGHFIVLTGTEIVNGEEIIRVNDSARASPENGIVYQTIPLFEQSADRFIFISPK